jgi:hypothetical protein
MRVKRHLTHLMPGKGDVILADDHTHRSSKPPTGNVFSQSISGELYGEAVNGIDAIETARTPNSDVRHKPYH